MTCPAIVKYKIGVFINSAVYNAYLHICGRDFLPGTSSYFFTLTICAPYCNNAVCSFKKKIGKTVQFCLYPCLFFFFFFFVLFFFFSQQSKRCQESIYNVVETLNGCLQIRTGCLFYSKNVWKFWGDFQKGSNLFSGEEGF